MAALEAAAAPASAPDPMAPDPMAALEAAVVKAVPPPDSKRSGPAPFDFFEAFQRARPEQAAAPRCESAASTAAAASALQPASGVHGSSSPSAQEATAATVEQAHPELGPKPNSSPNPSPNPNYNPNPNPNPIPNPNPNPNPNQAHPELDPLARLLVRQNRQVHVRVPRQASAASDPSDARPRAAHGVTHGMAEGRRGQPQRFAPSYDTGDRAAGTTPQD